MDYHNYFFIFYVDNFAFKKSILFLTEYKMDEYNFRVKKIRKFVGDT